MRFGYGIGTQNPVFPLEHIWDINTGFLAYQYLAKLIETRLTPAPKLKV
jgi:hypothetical protein